MLIQGICPGLGCQFNHFLGANPGQNNNQQGGKKQKQKQKQKQNNNHQQQHKNKKQKIKNNKTIKSK
jgi:hypothetical protein